MSRRPIRIGLSARIYHPPEGAPELLDGAPILDEFLAAARRRW